MYILVDREKLKVLYKHQSPWTLSQLAHIEIAHAAVTIMEDTKPTGYEGFTFLELKLLYENTCGQKYTGYSREVLISNLMGLCGTLEPSDVNSYEVKMQADAITDADQGYYKYVRGSFKPSEQQELFAINALTSCASFAPIPYTPTVPSVAPASYTQAVAVPATPATPRVRAPESNEPPKQGSKTGRVWEIADELHAKHTGMDAKSLRKLVIEACEAAGINSSTASVQWSKWRSSKNI